jgi:GTPase SAR1 family protein
MERIPNYDFCAIVLGLSGHGKSALLSSLYNYLSGNSPENFEIPFPVSGGSRSFTEAVKYYPIKSIHDQRTYLFIDTPGFDDTQGTQSREYETLRDIKQNLNKIKKINAVIYVKNSTVYRQYESFRKASNLIPRVLNNDIKEISIAVLTYVDKNNDILFEYDNGNGRYINPLIEQTDIRFDERRIFCVDNKIHNYTKSQIKKNAVRANQY